jgi:hypothetical protein
MIIIKTKNGSVFVNEQETLQVVHDKEAARVEIWLRTEQGGAVPTRFIEDVESVTYTTKETEYTDKGSEVESLQEKCDEQHEYILRLNRQQNAIKDDLHRFACDMEQLVCHCHDLIPLGILKQIQTPALSLKSKVLNDEYRNIE